MPNPQALFQVSLEPSAATGDVKKLLLTPRDQMAT